MILHSRVLFGDIRHFSGYLKSLNMSSRRHKSRKRSRSRSPSSRQNSVASPDVHHEGSPPTERRKDENDSLQKILQSIESLSSRIDSLESRANQPETITDTLYAFEKTRVSCYKLCKENESIKLQMLALRK